MFQTITLPYSLTAIGNTDLLIAPLLALFCSNRCPASLILQAHDLAHRFVEQEIPVVSGFHTPVEKEMLTVLLRGKQPIIYCPARSIDTWRVPKEFHAPIEQGRMLVVSPFSEKEVRITAELAEERNQLVAKLASRVLVIYAAEGSKTEEQCNDWVANGKPVITLAGPHTVHLSIKGVISHSAASLLNGLQL